MMTILYKTKFNYNSLIALVFSKQRNTKKMPIMSSTGLYYVIYICDTPILIL